MSTQTFEWKLIKVEVRNVGPDFPPWSKLKDPSMRYEVKVRLGGDVVIYQTSAWGSVVECAKYTEYLKRNTGAYKGAEERLDHKAIGAMVVDELASAMNDPDEFLCMLVEGKKGIEQLNALRNGERVILGAMRFGHAIVEAAEQVREEGLL